MFLLSSSFISSSVFFSLSFHYYFLFSYFLPPLIFLFISFSLLTSRLHVTANLHSTNTARVHSLSSFHFSLCFLGHMLLSASISISPPLSLSLSLSASLPLCFSHSASLTLLLFALKRYKYQTIFLLPYIKKWQKHLITELAIERHLFYTFFFFSFLLTPSPKKCRVSLGFASNSPCLGKRRVLVWNASADNKRDVLSAITTMAAMVDHRRYHRHPLQVLFHLCSGQPLFWSDTNVTFLAITPPPPLSSHRRHHLRQSHLSRVIFFLIFYTFLLFFHRTLFPLCHPFPLFSRPNRVSIHFAPFLRLFPIVVYLTLQLSSNFIPLTPFGNYLCSPLLSSSSLVLFLSFFLSTFIFTSISFLFSPISCFYTISFSNASSPFIPPPSVFFLFYSRCPSFSLFLTFYSALSFSYLFSVFFLFLSFHFFYHILTFFF
ncbi:unnamed protein product [Acanthosepion pharaonis]|uniref:Uncharacterized protein n=1 Tax=Acanthosepion pharaonis TaxID=158019 RepID=A0A812B4N4_ACAPH|nr:unnamed protein product [Sepia pharaonis]